MEWHIELFDEKAKDETLDFPPKMLAKLIHIFELIKSFGPQLKEPYIKALGNGLFEIRVKSQEGIGRSIFCYTRNKKIIILHSFIKKTRKTPKKEIEIALARKKEVENES